MIPLREIPPEGVHRDYDLSGEFAARALEGTEVDVGESTVTASIDLGRTGVEVFARGKLGGALNVVCSRCAGPARVAVDQPVAVLFVPRGSDRAESEGGDDLLEQPDVVAYSDEEIDLGEILREELLLALPLAPLCTEACKGLCARCGKDLNEGPCECPEVPPGDRWSALRNVKLD